MISWHDPVWWWLQLNLLLSYSVWFFFFSNYKVGCWVYSSSPMSKCCQLSWMPQSSTLVQRNYEDDVECHKVCCSQLLSWMMSYNFIVDNYKVGFWVVTHLVLGRDETPYTVPVGSCYIFMYIWGQAWPTFRQCPLWLGGFSHLGLV